MAVSSTSPRQEESHPFLLLWETGAVLATCPRVSEHFGVQNAPTPLLLSAQMSFFGTCRTWALHSLQLPEQCLLPLRYFSPKNVRGFPA